MPTMPNVVGLDYEDALSALIAAGVRSIPLGYFQDDPVTLNWTSLNIQPYTVLGQIPAWGTNLTVNASVALLCSSPPINIAINSNVQKWSQINYSGWNVLSQSINVPTVVSVNSVVIGPLTVNSSLTVNAPLAVL